MTAITTKAFKNLSAQDALKAAARLGVREIELDRPLSGEEEARSVRKCAEENGLTVYSYKPGFDCLHGDFAAVLSVAAALGAKTVMPIHWGAFVLSRHAWDDPPERFVRAAAAEGIPCVTPRLGERMELSQYEKYTRRWWRGME